MKLISRTNHVEDANPRLLSPTTLAARALIRAGGLGARRVARLETRRWEGPETLETRVLSGVGTWLPPRAGDAELARWLEAMRECLPAGLSIRFLAFSIDAAPDEVPSGDASVLAPAALRRLFETALNTFHRDVGPDWAGLGAVRLHLRRFTRMDGRPDHLHVARAEGKRKLRLQLDSAALGRFESEAGDWLAGCSSFLLAFSTPVPTAHQRAAALARSDTP